MLRFTIKKHPVLMKQLILTFFLVILCFSLFFDKKTAEPVRDKIILNQADAFKPYLTDIAPENANTTDSIVWITQLQ